MSNGNGGNGDLRLIEDYLPIKAISRENTAAKGHPNTLHLWWARRPLVACRAAVYSALVPADRAVKDIEIKNPPADPVKLAAMKNGAKRGLNRKAAGEFVSNLCAHPPEARYVQQAQQHVLDAHAARLSAEMLEAKSTGKIPGWVDERKIAGTTVTSADIAQGRAPRPRLLDLFAGGGAIPLEAQRLGCDVYANELNPVSHVIELCALVYSPKYGSPDPKAFGATGPKNAEGKTTWRGMADEVRHWGTVVFERVRASIGDLYPLVPDPSYKARRSAGGSQSVMWKSAEDVPAGYLIPVAYIWTRTVRCKKPTCGAIVPMVRQTWLCKRGDRFVAMDMVKRNDPKRVGFKLVEADTEDGFAFDPTGFSKGGNATCPFCSTVADSAYAKQVGTETGFGIQPMAIMCIRPGESGKVYVPFEDAGDLDADVARRLGDIEKRWGITPPTEPLEANPRSFDVQRYGFVRWRSAFTERQNLLHLTVAAQLRAARAEIEKAIVNTERATALYTAVALSFSRLITQHNAFAMIHTGRETIEGPWGDGKFPMSWDFVEANPFSGVTASYQSALEWAVRVYAELAGLGEAATAVRGSATQLPFTDAMFDAVITDPPYYDNYSYSNLSDAYYVWLKRSLGEVHPSHFASELTPKKSEAIKATYRLNGDDAAASKRYENLMTESLREAHRVLKPGGTIAIVYAHKTTLGWSTLVDALRAAGFTIVEAWPMDTEAKGGRKKVDKAMLASSIFLVARKRDPNAGVGAYEATVQPELEQIVRERVNTLWEMGIVGADLIIAAVGAGLRAFTRFERVEYSNGEDVPASKFLAEVEGVVLDTMLAKLFGVTGGSVSAIDPASRFYVLWRFVYKAAEIEAGEAIVFTYGQHVELDGQEGLSEGKDALLSKKKGKYRAYDFTERGANEKLGLPSEDGRPAPLIDVLHRAIWLMENSPRKLGDFFDEARPDREHLRVLAQALAGTALGGKSEPDTEKLVSTTPAEQGALAKLLANWRSLVESRLAAGEVGLFAAKK